jgi:aminoacyl tRNA synthase complex-interacting multifunctional protein 1
MLMQSFRFGLKNILYRQMASADILLKLRQNATDADQIISQLKVQLQDLQQMAAAKACSVESERLAKENAVLRHEVEQLKQELITLETQNGVQQIPLPNTKLTTPASSNIAAPAVTKASVFAANNASAQKPVAEVASQSHTGAPQKSKKGNEVKSKENKQDAARTTKAAPKSAKSDEKSGDQPLAAVASDSPASATGAGAGASGEDTVTVSRLNMRIGRIVAVKKHPDADSLYVEEVDVGEAKHRTIISGLVKHVPIDQMLNRVAVFLLNLKPAKMRGIMSEGMIMCASTPELVEIIVPPEGVTIGERVTVEGYPGVPDDVLNPKKKTWEQIQPELRIDSNGLATYKGALWKIEGKAGVFKAPTLVNSPIR